MREQLQTRLAVLKKEFETGQARLQELESRQRTLRDTLLRISGAIQVLEEELTQTDQHAPVEAGRTETHRAEARGSTC
jgi:chromosome segregation ATPase